MDTNSSNELSKEDKELLEEKMKVLRKARCAEIEKLLLRTSKLSTTEYLGLLYEIQKNFSAYLAMMSIAGDFRNCGAASTIIERVHYLIDSAETKVEREKPKETDDILEGLLFTLPKYNEALRDN
jgi:hypothetical protein